MCLPGMTSVLTLLPLLWVIVMPIIGAFSGPETVLRLSLLMMVYSLLETCVQRFVKFLLPLFSISFFVVIVSLPVSVVPYPLVWLYGHMIWMSEPLALLMEAIGTVQILMLLSRKLVGHIEDNALLAKGIILGAAIGAYISSVILAVLLYRTESPTIRWLLLIIIIVSVVHLILTITFDQGIISNSAVVTLCMMGALCFGFYEANLIENPLSEPKEWSDESSDLRSLIQMLLSLATSSMSHVTKATRFLYQLISPVLITMILIRAVSVLQVVQFGVKTLTQYVLDDDDDIDIVEDSHLEEVEIDDACLPFCSDLGHASVPTKLSLIFVYTQLVFRTMVLSAGHSPYRLYVPTSLQMALVTGPLKQVGTLRVAQIAVLALFYPLRLYREGDDDDVDW